MRSERQTLWQKLKHWFRWYILRRRDPGQWRAVFQRAYMPDSARKGFLVLHRKEKKDETP